jgi:hypothetical protein
MSKSRNSVAAVAALCLAPAAAAAQVAPTIPDYSTAMPRPGSWGYAPVAGGSSARFVDTSGTARLVIQCTMATRRVTIALTSAAPAATLSVWTTSLTRALPARFEANAMRVASEVAATDPLLDAIAFSRGRIAVDMPGSVAVVAPAAPEAARVIEDCRN